MGKALIQWIYGNYAFGDCRSRNCALRKPACVQVSLQLVLVCTVVVLLPTSPSLPCAEGDHSQTSGRWTAVRSGHVG